MVTDGSGSCSGFGLPHTSRPRWTPPGKSARNAIANLATPAATGRPGAGLGGYPQMGVRPASAIPSTRTLYQKTGANPASTINERTPVMTTSRDVDTGQRVTVTTTTTLTATTTPAIPLAELSRILGGHPDSGGQGTRHPQGVPARRRILPDLARGAGHRHAGHRPGNSHRVARFPSASPGRRRVPSGSASTR